MQNRKRLNELFGDCNKELLAKFREFDKANPQVYTEFEKLSIAIKETGRRHYSHWAVLGCLRYNLSMLSQDEFKLNNRLFALYARKLIFYRPEFLGFYNLRAMKS